MEQKTTNSKNSKDPNKISSNKTTIILYLASNKNYLKYPKTTTAKMQ